MARTRWPPLSAVALSRDDSAPVSSSRAWCMRGIMQMLAPSTVSVWQRFGELAGEHVRSAELAVTEGEYVSTHWLVSFVLLAETEWQG